MMKVIKTLHEKNFKQIKEAFDNGELIIFPTETCYGVGVDATNQVAVDKLLKYKRRLEGKAISIAVSDKKMSEEYVVLNTVANELYSRFLPGPFTIISSSKGRVAKGLESERKTLGIRMPGSPNLLKLIKYLGRPLTSTSANSAGKKTPYSWSDLECNLSSKQKAMIGLFIDDGELSKNPPSTVIDTTRNDLQILRKGSSIFKNLLFEKITNDYQKTIKLGAKFGEDYILKSDNNCIIVLYNADLGAGKTQFTKGIATSLGIKEIVKSPTFSILTEYDIRKDNLLVHFDAWRLQTLDELFKLGLEKYIKMGNVICVEWAGASEEFFLKLSKNSYIKIYEISIDYIEENTRKIEVRN